jgi:hypothetical protein
VTWGAFGEPDCAVTGAARATLPPIIIDVTTRIATLILQATSRRSLI